MKFSTKVLFAALALGVMGSPIVRAQDDAKAPPADAPKGERKGGNRGGGRGMPNAEERLGQIEKAVGTLTADQKAKIKDILAKEQGEMQALRGNGGGDREAMRANRDKMQGIMKNYHDQIRAVLTEDQQKKFDEMPAGGGRGGPGGPGGGRKKKDN